MKLLQQLEPEKRSILPVCEHFQPQNNTAYVTKVNFGSHLIALCDIGTQTFRLAVVSIKDALPCLLRSEIRHVRLGQGLEATGMISDGAMKRAIDAFEDFNNILSAYPCILKRVVATHALRCAGNADEFCALASEFGFEIEVISGEEEARLSVLGVKSTIGLAKTALAVDVGGGSTELNWLCDGALVYSESVPIGCVTLTERFLSSDVPSIQEQKMLSDFIDTEIKKVLSKFASMPEQVVGVGGSTTTIAAALLELEVYEPDKIRGLTVSELEIDALFNKLSVLPVKERAKQKGLSPKRADIILAGIALFQNIIKNLLVTNITITDGGLMIGLLIDILQKEFQIYVKPSYTTGLYI